jgi:hypothetical protein
MSFVKLRSIFAVTTDESNRIPELHPKPKPLPQRKAQKIKDAIHLLMAEYGLLPCASDLLSLLTTQGVKTSLVSIYRYMKEMGLTGHASKDPILKISARKSSSNITVLTGQLRKVRTAHGFDILPGGTKEPLRNPFVPYGQTKSRAKR